MQAIALILALATVGGDFDPNDFGQPTPAVRAQSPNSLFPTNGEIPGPRSPRRGLDRSLPARSRDAASTNLRNGGLQPAKFQNELDRSTSDLVTPVQYQDPRLPQRAVDGIIGPRSRLAATDPTATQERDMEPIPSFAGRYGPNESTNRQTNSGPELALPKIGSSPTKPPYSNLSPNEDPRRPADQTSSFESTLNNRDLPPLNAPDLDRPAVPDLNTQYVPASRPVSSQQPPPSYGYPNNRQSQHAGEYSPLGGLEPNAPNLQNRTPAESTFSTKIELPTTSVLGPRQGYIPSLAVGTTNSSPAETPAMKNPREMIPTSSPSPAVNPNSNPDATNTTPEPQYRFDDGRTSRDGLGTQGYFMTLLALFASVGLNFYLGWIAWDTYNRYQELVSDIRHGSHRERGERRIPEAAAY